MMNQADAVLLALDATERIYDCPIGVIDLNEVITHGLASTKDIDADLRDLLKPYRYVDDLFLALEHLCQMHWASRIESSYSVTSAGKIRISKLPANGPINVNPFEEHALYLRG